MERTEIVDAGQVKEEILAFAGYNDFEAAADRTAVKIKEGFMEMGYILKIARDTDILAGSGYANHEDFAAKRYDLDKGTVSRYIRIVEHFSVDGNSHILKDSYKNMGFAKLSLMLHMPDAIAEELMDSLSKTEVSEIKEEIDAERQITDIELAIEQAENPAPPETAGDTLLTKMIRQLGREQQDLYCKLWRALSDDTVDIGEVLAPQGDAVYMVRIPGMGRIMLSIQDTAACVTAVRSGEKERCTIQDIREALLRICRTSAGSAEESFWEVYGEQMSAEPEPQETKVAPVQPLRKQSKVTKANTGKSKEPAKVSLAAGVTEPEEQLPGQMDVTDFPQMLPGNTQAPEPAVDGGEGTEPQETANTSSTTAGSTEDHAGLTEAASAGAPAAGEEMLDKDWENLWTMFGSDILIASDVWDFYEYDDMINDKIPRSTLDKAYKAAINVAAALERMINGQKYST